MARTAEQHVRAVAASAKASEAARRKLHAAIRDARGGGVPLRAIAEAAGLSPETVRTIAREA